jgi:hypothetical protein
MPVVGLRPGAASPRAELARVALEAAVGVQGVVAGNAGPAGQYVTDYGGVRLAGVVAAAQGAGRFSVDLFLTAELVPLRELAERLPAVVAEAATKAQLGNRLGSVTVSFLDVEHPLGWTS